MTDQSLEAIRRFWNMNPCDGQPDVESRTRYRYRKDSWLPPLLDSIAKGDESLLEVGCGQGTDGIYLCLRKQEGSYEGVDISERSIGSAKQAAEQFAACLKVNPVFRTGNAECLDYDDASFDSVYSYGVLHHSPDTVKALEEIHRVLKDGGTGYVFLYRSSSPKVLAAHALRFLSGLIDRVTHRDRLIWKAISRFGSNHRFGTMALECFGVPILKSYNQSQIREMFSIFSAVDIGSTGAGIPGTDLNRFWDRYGKGRFGTMWQIVCKK